MTLKEYRRRERLRNKYRKWDLRCQPAYRAGVMDGTDMAFCGEPRPGEWDSEYDMKFYLRPILRRAQEISNAAIARHRGKVDGWDSATEQMRLADEDDYIEAQVLQGMVQIESYLRQRAA